MKNRRERGIRRVQAFLERIEWMFELNNFERSIVVKGRDEAHPDFSSYTMYALIDYDEVYRRVRVELYPEFFKRTLAEQRKILLHELCHSITHGQAILNSQVMDGAAVTKHQFRHENERETSKIENLLHGLLVGRYRYARNAYRDYAKIKKAKRRKK